jgi:hypothetical protein
MELRNFLAGQGSMPGEDVSQWLLRMRRGRPPPELQASAPGPLAPRLLLGNSRRLIMKREVLKLGQQVADEAEPRVEAGSAHGGGPKAFGCERGNQALVRGVGSIVCHSSVVYGVNLDDPDTAASRVRKVMVRAVWRCFHGPVGRRCT